MNYSVEELSHQAVYKLLTATVTPRPIAWVTTCCKNKTVNAAPFSFFNIMGDEPPMAVFSVDKSYEKDKKDTVANIIETGEFVINLVPFKLARQMSFTAINSPYGFDELKAAKIETIPSKTVKVPQIALSPVAFECVNHATMLTGARQYLVIGRVVQIRIDDDYILDKKHFHIDTQKLDLIGKMQGSTYTKCHDTFDIKRISFNDWQDQSEN